MHRVEIRPSQYIYIQFNQKGWNPKFQQLKDLMQGKLFQRCSHLLYRSVLSLGGNVNTRRMLQPDMRSIFHIKNQWNILVIGNYYVNYQNYQNLMILNEHCCVYSCLQIPPKENWFQYVRRVYTTTINFPCITSLQQQKLC